MKSNDLLAKLLSSYYINAPIEGRAEISGYTASPEETDASPGINAIGQKPKQGDIASRFFPFGTKVYVEGFKQPFIVRDRMNKRYGPQNLDILFPTKEEAFDYGRKSGVKVQYVLPNRR